MEELIKNSLDLFQHGFPLLTLGVLIWGLVLLLILLLIITSTTMTSSLLVSIKYFLVKRKPIKIEILKDAKTTATKVLRVTLVSMIILEAIVDYGVNIMLIVFANYIALTLLKTDNLVLILGGAFLIGMIDLFPILCMLNVNSDEISKVKLTRIGHHRAAFYMVEPLYVKERGKKIIDLTKVLILVRRRLLR